MPDSPPGTSANRPPWPTCDLIASEAFDDLVSRCVRFSAEELSKRHGIPFAEAETLNPALLVYQSLLRRTRADRMLVSEVSMRDGLLLELARDVTGVEDEALAAKRDPVGHVDRARSITPTWSTRGRWRSWRVRLFDELQADHGLGSRHRLLLRVAGLLHEIGGFVSNRSHHKHSYYLI